MTCEEIQKENLHEKFLFNELRGAVLREYRQHISSCSRCQKDLRTQQLLVRSLQEIGMDNMKEEIRRQISDFGSDFYRPGFSRNTRVLIVVTLLLLATTAIYFGFFHSSKPRYRKNPRLEKFLSSPPSNDSAFAQSSPVHSRKLEKAFQFLEKGNTHSPSTPSSASSKIPSQKQKMAGSSSSSTVSRPADDPHLFPFFRAARVALPGKNPSQPSNSSAPVPLYKFKSGKRYILVNLHPAQEALPSTPDSPLPRRFPVEILLKDSALVVMDWFVNTALQTLPPEQLAIYRTDDHTLLVRINGENRYRIPLNENRTEAFLLGKN